MFGDFGPQVSTIPTEIKEIDSLFGWLVAGAGLF
jgi:hypothetical protein